MAAEVVNVRFNIDFESIGNTEGLANAVNRTKKRVERIKATMLVGC